MRGVRNTASAMKIRMALLGATDDCWPWDGAVNSASYPVTGWAGRTVLAHRLAYELFVGPIHEGLTIDHVCQNTRCVNPLHLEPVSSLVNVQRYALRRTVCKNGHSLDGVQPNERGYRPCPTCRVDNRRRARAARKAVAA